MNVIVLLSVAMFPAETRSQFTCTGYNGSITISRLIGSSGDVAVPCAINGYLVTSVGARAFFDCRNPRQAYFQENAPSVNGRSGSTNNTVFAFDEPDWGTGWLEYVPGNIGWSARFGGWRRALWRLQMLQIGPSTRSGLTACVQRNPKYRTI